MHLLADENQHGFVVSRLRAAWNRIEWITETMPGTTDADILRRPDIEAMTLLAYDRDYGDVIFNRGLPSPAPILYTRLNRLQPEVIADRLLALLEAGIAPGHMTTIIKDGTRIKPFPPGALA